MNRQPILPGFDFESNGTDNEEDIELVDISDIDKLTLWPSDWTVETIIRQIEKGTILLNPDFQRRDVWTVERKSRFIESLIVNLPVPQIVLAEDPLDRSKFVVVDGKQRLLSILQFFGSNNWDRYKLKGLKILDNNDCDIDSISPTTKNELENRSIRCIIIKGTPSTKLLTIIFHRLNSNTIALSSQELRQSLYSGPFTSFADKYTREEIYLSELFGGSGPDFRMRDVELLIRYLAFKNHIETYNGNLKSFLDKTVETFNANWSTFNSQVIKQAGYLKSSIQAAYELLDEDAFRKYIPSSEKFEYRFNRSIFDIFVYYLSEENTANLLIKNKNNFVSDFKEMFTNIDFVKSIESTTKSKNAVKTRFTLFGKLVKKFDLTVVIPNFY